MNHTLYIVDLPPEFKRGYLLGESILHFLMFNLASDAAFSLVLEYLEVTAHARLYVTLQHLYEETEFSLLNEVFRQLLALLVTPVVQVTQQGVMEVHCLPDLLVVIQSLNYVTKLEILLTPMLLGVIIIIRWLLPRVSFH